MQNRSVRSAELGHRSRSRIPWAFAALAIVGLVPTMVLTVSNGSLDEDPLFIPVAVMMIVGYSVTGAVLASRQPMNAIGWLLLAVGVLFLLVGLSDEYMQWVYRDGPSDAPLGPVVGLITSVLWLPMIAIVSLLLLLFPTGSVPGPRWRLLPWIIGSTIGLFLLGSVLAPGRSRTRGSRASSFATRRAWRPWSPSPPWSSQPRARWPSCASCRASPRWSCGSCGLAARNASR